MDTLRQIFAQARTTPQTIVLPEGDDPRIRAAATQLTERGLARIILLTETDDAPKNDPIKILHPGAIAAQYADFLTQLFADKGKPLSSAQVSEMLNDSLTLAACMVANGDADGCVAGATHTTADVVRTALRIVGSKPVDGRRGLVSSFFIMHHQLPHQALRGAAIFADCALLIAPDAAQLAQIAIDASDSAAQLCELKPKVALLSFSTAGSAEHELVQKVRDAADLVKAARPDLALLPEVQFDAAVVPEILRQKAPNMGVDAPANVFIFPDLQAANIGYKIAQRIGGAIAVGPILQGLARPVNDLSRGAKVEDIVATVAVTAVQAQHSTG